jgi:hypothetical protein
MRSRVDIASDIKVRLGWSVPSPSPPDPNSHSELWLKCVKEAQMEMDLIGIVPSQPENPEVIRCVRGFVAWKLWSAPEANLPSEQDMSRCLLFS